MRGLCTFRKIRGAISQGWASGSGECSITVLAEMPVKDGAAPSGGTWRSRQCVSLGPQFPVLAPLVPGGLPRAFGAAVRSSASFFSDLQ